MDKAEIVIYKDAQNTDFQIEVRVENDTVWLTQTQMAELFRTTRNNVTLHIGNIFKEKELNVDSVCKDFLLTARDGKKYNTKFYNLDVIISVGYRVKSKRGTQFRIWANRILKEYLLKGHIVSYRLARVEEEVDHIKDQVNKLEFRIQTNLPPTEGVFFDGQIFDAYHFAVDVIKSAKKSVVLIDNYVDESVLVLLSKRNTSVEAIIYTKSMTDQLKLDLKKFNAQYPTIAVKIFSKSHDRFLIIDKSTVYHLGASLKDLGKKWFAFSKIEHDALEIISKLP